MVKSSDVCNGSGLRPAAILGNDDKAKGVCPNCFFVVSLKKDKTTVKHALASAVKTESGDSGGGDDES